MKKCAVVLAAVGVFVLRFVVCVFASELSWEDISRGNLNLKTILVHPDNPRIIYIGSRQGIFRSEDGGETWRNIFSVRGANRDLNFLLFALGDKNSLYAATGNGLFFSANQGRGWSRIFKGKNSLENECTTLAVSLYGIYVGTKAGLFFSKDKGRSWHKETGRLGTSCILAIAYNLKEPSSIYVATVDGIFKTVDSGHSWERVFVSHPVEKGKDIEEVTEDRDEEERVSDIRCISIDPNNLNELYLASSKGIYRSKNKGLTWERLSDYGLLNRDTRFLLVSKESKLYTLTKSGIFEFRDYRWYELSLGLVAQDIRSLALDKQGNLYAACDKGLFKASLNNSINDGQSSMISFYGKDEPKINEVQQAAIKYAEVEPQKIARWREQAAKKAFLPKVSASVNRDTADLWHWESGSTTKTGDDVLIRGRDSLGWDVTLSWDLGELIWNENQTSIDVRSRLMVELRDDILDEVTKLYFERLRVKLELDNLSIEDRKKRLEKDLRLEELTASLDALTGGYFSQHIKNNKIDS